MPPPSSEAHPELRALRPTRVCIIKPSALGDVVSAFPALTALRELWPQASFAWVINRSLRALVDGHPAIDRVIVLPRDLTGFGPTEWASVGRLVRDLRGGRFDLAIDLQGLFRSGLMAAVTAAPVRVGPGDAREGATWFYTHRIGLPGSRTEIHAVDRMLALAAAFGADIGAPRWEVAVGAGDRAWAREVLGPVGRPRLGLNLGARWETKRWPPAHFAEIGRQAVAERGAGLFAIGAPEDRPLVDELIARLAPIPVVDLCGRTTLPQLAALAKEADLVVSNDTGPLHLAGAAGARVVGIYTCTSPALNGPYGPTAAAVQSSVSCAGSYHVKCPYALDCMRELSPDRVWPVVLAQLDAELPENAAPAAALGDARP
jgi:lipopolysaccharide heptosyltransferase II